MNARQLVSVGVVLGAVVACWLVLGDSRRPAAVETDAPHRSAATGDVAPPRLLGNGGTTRVPGPKQQSDSPLSDEAAPATRDVRGRVLDENGRPIVGIRIAFEDAARFVRTEALSMEGGRFAIDSFRVGQVVYAHRAEGTGPFRATWFPRSQNPVLLGRFELPAGDTPFEIDLVLTPPPAIVDVLVLDETGAPAAEAQAHFIGRSSLGPDGESRHWLRGDTGSGFAYATDDGDLRWQLFDTTDADGRASLALWPMKGFLGGTVFASTGGYERASAAVEVASPFVPGLRTLRQSLSGSVTIEVRDPDGSSRPGVSVSLHSRGQRLPIRAEHLPNAVYRFDPVPTGPCRVVVRNPWNDEPQERRIEVASGELTAEVFELDDGPLGVAFEGRLFDEDEKPLPASTVTFEYSVDGGPPNFGSLYARDRCVGWAMPGELVTVRISTGPLDGAFEPRAQRVPFGTRDVRFRRVAQPASLNLRMQAVDASTRAPIDVHWLLERTSTARSDATDYEHYPTTKATALVLAHPDLRWRAVAVGYREASGLVSDQIDLARQTGTLHAALTPGFRLDVRAIDADSERPLANAVFHSDTAPSATSDGEGRVRLEANQWPVYVVELEGYETDRIDPARGWFIDMWADGIVALSPVSGDD